MGKVTLFNEYSTALILGIKGLGKLDPGWVALLGTIFGGVGLKVAEKWLSKGRENAEANAQQGRDYRLEIKELTDRMDVVEKREEEWREKYFKSQEENAELRVKLKKTGNTGPTVV
jgi:hypothetical protein